MAYRRHGDLGAAGFDLVQAKLAREGAHLSDELERMGHPDCGGVDVWGGGGGFCGDGGGSDVRLGGWGWWRVCCGGRGPLEVKYLLKLMLGDMRIGVKQSLVEEAIAVAASEAMSQSGVAVSVAAVRNAVMLEADLAGAVRRAFAGTLGEARMRLFHPLGFMLASPVETPEEAVERFSGKVDVESKEQRQRQKRNAGVSPLRDGR